MLKLTVKRMNMGSWSSLRFPGALVLGGMAGMAAHGDRANASAAAGREGAPPAAHMPAQSRVMTNTSTAACHSLIVWTAGKQRAEEKGGAKHWRAVAQWQSSGQAFDVQFVLRSCDSRTEIKGAVLPSAVLPCPERCVCGTC